MIMSTLFARTAAASTLLVALASPALAASKSAQNDFTVRYDAKADRYCITPKTAPTGSRLRVEDCRSKAQWAYVGTIITTRADTQLANR